MTDPKTWYFTPGPYKAPSPSISGCALEYTELASEMGLNLQVYPAWDYPEHFKAQYLDDADLALFRLQVGV